MSKTFTPRSAVRMNRQAPSNNQRGQGRDTGNGTQSQRGRGRGAGTGTGTSTSTYSSTPTRGRGVGTSTSTYSTPTRGRGASTFTPGTVIRGRGTILNTNTRPRVSSNNRMDDFQRPGDGASSCPQRSDPEQEAGDQQGQYAGGFTKFGPNAKKRQQVSEMARKETEEYERYKQQTAMKYCNYVGTTGGGEKTEDMVRRKQANDVRNQKFNRLQNQQKRREEMRDNEQREIDLKRAEARRKANENAQNDRAARPADVRRQREDFLRRFEDQSRTTDATAALENVSLSSPARRTVAKPPSSSPSQGQASRRGMDRLSNPEPDTTTTRRSYGEEDKKFPVEDFPEDVMTLAAMLPDIDMTYLNSLYKDAGSVEAVLDIIGV